MKIKLLILCLFIACAGYAQEVVFDTIIISKPDSILLLTHYEKLSDGTVRGKIGGATQAATSYSDKAAPTSPSTSSHETGYASAGTTAAPRRPQILPCAWTYSANHLAGG